VLINIGLPQGGEHASRVDVEWRTGFTLPPVRVDGFCGERPGCTDARAGSTISVLGDFGVGPTLRRAGYTTKAVSLYQGSVKRADLVETAGHAVVLTAQIPPGTPAGRYDLLVTYIDLSCSSDGAGCTRSLISNGVPLIVIP
jgi:hypothetical protein